MKLIVGKHIITKSEQSLVNEKEINVNICQFEFDSDITDDFVKEAYFTLNNNTYKQIIVNDQCEIPYEVLEQKGQVEIGVVAYKVQDEETIIRYNPKPICFETLLGSLKNAKNSQPITPSEMEQYEQELQDGLAEVDSKLQDINVAIEEANNLDIDANKSEKTTTVTIIKKDGTSKEVNIYDGVDGVDGVDGKDGQNGRDGRDGVDGIGIDYNWQGTSLGIKREDEQNYDYVNLKGEKGQDGSPGQPGTPGTTGNGISNIEKTRTSGLIDTYTITYTNGNSSTFTVTNGADGRDGTNGTNGSDGVGISNIQKTSTSGLVDTYTITYTNGNSSTFTVTNGQNGTNGQDGYTPVRGVDYWTSSDIATIEAYCDSLVLGALGGSY